ncbi:MAG TPA: LemA family protein [Myxococcota bacterium]|nr:LemA family protein [Myxococcota bacterium]
MILWLLVLGLIGIAFWAISAYNRLVRLRNGSEGAWSDIDVQLKRRCELVPNLVETVKGYASHEAATLERVTVARGAALGARSSEDRSAAEGALSKAIGSLLAVAEAYPQLEADESFVALQRELSALEDAIQSARRYYNAVVRDLNTSVEAFPSNLVAAQFGFEKREYFELDGPEERKAPAVRFGA